MGRTLTADAVVLALGNPPPGPPDGLDPDLLGSEHYVGDPWAWSGSAGGIRGDVLLIGSGLTAIDVALTIIDSEPDARLFALSRHGLLPRQHGAASPARPEAAAPVGTPAQVLAQVRRRATSDWRGAIDDLRPHVHTIWRSWTIAARRRFLRPLRPWWTVHRDR